MTPQFLDPRLPMRFWDKCIPEPNSGCWLWVGCLQSAGYGMLSVKESGRWHRRYAHRLSYAALVGEIAVGLEIDHLCRTTPCCNPQHLEAVTPKVNVGRGLAGPKDRCPRGHLYEQNEYIRPDIHTRQCLQCCLDRAHARGTALRSQWAHAGRCVRCGSDRDSTFKTCAACRAYNAETQRRRRSLQTGAV